MSDTTAVLQTWLSLPNPRPRTVVAVPELLHSRGPLQCLSLPAPCPVAMSGPVPGCPWHQQKHTLRTITQLLLLKFHQWNFSAQKFPLNNMLTVTANNDVARWPFTSHRDNHKCLTCYIFVSADCVQALWEMCMLLIVITATQMSSWH